MTKAEKDRLRRKVRALRKDPYGAWPQFGPGIPEGRVAAVAAFNAALDQVDDILVDAAVDAITAPKP